jgi:3-dehydrosphinganine reductase
MTDIAGRHVVVTGGSSGIGLATARLLARGGARVSLVARDPSRLADAARAVGPSTEVASVDVRDPDRVRTAFEGLVAASGPCDVLVAAAGYSEPGYYERLADQSFRDQMDVNYFGSLHSVRAVTPSMQERGVGHVVLVASTAALMGVFGYTAYAPAKYAVRGLAETLRVELAPHGIVVACAYPPDTDTPGYARELAQQPPETAAISERIKPVDPTTVAAAIARGIEKDRLVITADFQTAALARAAGLLAPYLRFTMDRSVRKVRRSGGTFTT